MPFDGLRIPLERDPPRRHGEQPERPPTVRDRIVFISAAMLLAMITLANCRLLLGYWHGGAGHGGSWHG